MRTADLLEGVSGLVPGGDLTPWFLVGGAVALYLAYRAARLAARVVSLGVAATLFLGAGPVAGGSAPVPLPWADDDGSAPAQVAAPAGAFRAVVTRVVDGDSLRVRVTDAGTTPATRDAELEVRLLRIDAPELERDGRGPDCLADEAAAALARLVPPGSEVRGSHDLQRRDTYGRDLVHLWDADGRWVNGAMLTAGLARLVTFPPNTGYEQDVHALETSARAARRGIWDPAVCPR